MARALEMDMKVASAALGSTQLRSAAYERDRWKAGSKENALGDVARACNGAVIFRRQIPQVVSQGGWGL